MRSWLASAAGLVPIGTQGTPSGRKAIRKDTPALSWTRIGSTLSHTAGATHLSPICIPIPVDSPSAVGCGLGSGSVSTGGITGTENPGVVARPGSCSSTEGATFGWTSVKPHVMGWALSDRSTRPLRRRFIAIGDSEPRPTGAPFFYVPTDSRHVDGQRTRFSLSDVPRGHSSDVSR